MQQYNYNNTQQSNIVTKIKNEEHCSICYENFEKKGKIAKLSCGHLYHPECIKKWFGTKRDCPMCRKIFNENNGQQKFQNISSDYDPRFGNLLLRYQNTITLDPEPYTSEHVIRNNLAKINEKLDRMRRRDDQLINELIANEFNLIRCIKEFGDYTMFNINTYIYGDNETRIKLTIMLLLKFPVAYAEIRNYLIHMSRGNTSFDKLINLLPFFAYVAVKQNGLLLEQMPYYNDNYTIVHTAIEQNHFAYEFASERLKDNDDITNLVMLHLHNQNNRNGRNRPNNSNNSNYSNNSNNSNNSNSSNNNN